MQIVTTSVTNLEKQVAGRLSDALQRRLCCPACRSLVKVQCKNLVCESVSCRRSYPILEGTPILIDEDSSIFPIEKIQSQLAQPARREGKLKQAISRLTPSISGNVCGTRNYRYLSELLMKLAHSPKVLVVGGRISGAGMQPLLDHVPPVELVETDVCIGPRTSLVCDGHRIPFLDESFDGVIVQAVLEHVADPYRCVDEIHRVLKKDGVVYSETPFMQQVHEGRFDFTRFTHLGHRRLFRRFEEIDSGVACGPGMAFAWSLSYFLMSFTSSKQGRRLMQTGARFLGFPFKYFDPHLAKKSGAYDAASGYYFLGRKSTAVLSDKELVRQYRGAMQ